jgi:hypothetical protein
MDSNIVIFPCTYICTEIHTADRGNDVSYFRNNTVYFHALHTTASQWFSYVLQFQGQKNRKKWLAVKSWKPSVSRQLYAFQQSVMICSIYNLMTLNNVSLPRLVTEKNVLCIDLYSSKNPVPLNNTSTIVLPFAYFCFINLHCISVTYKFPFLTLKVQTFLS